MRRLIGMCVLISAVAPAFAAAQTSTQTPPRPRPPPKANHRRDRGGRARSARRSPRPRATPASGSCRRRASCRTRNGRVSFYRTNMDDGQGFTDISTFPVTFAVGHRESGRDLRQLGARHAHRPRHAAALLRRARAEEADTGTGGGIVPNHPLVRSEWTGNKLGDLWLGGKVSLFSARRSRARWASPRACSVKLPTGDEESGASTGQTDFILDGVVSGYSSAVDAGRLRRHDLARQSGRLPAHQRPALGHRRGVPAEVQSRASASRPSSSARSTSTATMTAPRGLFGCGRLDRARSVTV